MAKITLDQLAAMIARGFDEINTRLVNHDQKFDSMETRLTRLERGQEEILWRLDNKVRYKPGH